MSSDARLLDLIDGICGGKPGESFGVAVSGGSDSLALLHLMAAWGKAPVQAVTLDHGLRDAAADEAAYVAQICDGLEVEHHILKWHWDGKGNLPDRARRARYDLIADWASVERVGTVLVGHTKDDVAETFLMRLAREAGIDGLSVMDAQFTRLGVQFMRPFLDVSRDDLQAYLTRYGVEWVSDPSNDDAKYDRVKARKALAELTPLGITVDSLATVARNLGRARTDLQLAAQKAAELHFTFEDGDIVIEDASTLRRIGVEIPRRLLVAGMMAVSGADYVPRRGAVSEVDADLQLGRTCTAHGCLLTAKDDTIRITRELNAVKDIVSDTNSLWDGRWRFDGPHVMGLSVAALGEVGISECPDWRDSGLPRVSLLASPAVWRGDELVAAPLAGFANGWCVRLTRSREQFLSSLLSH
ncbi:tRNA lysidine(34) synthetase TilS [Litoreibacter sp.]|nr:tRNA lysidine(34) synthetase TilS [Litoreibacter sp.]